MLALLLGALSLFAAGPAVAQTTPPSVPQNVTATVGDGQITLNWEAPSSWGQSGWTPRGYSIDWRFSGGTWGLVSGGTPSASPSDTSFVFTGTHGTHTVSNGNSFDLRIQAYIRNSDSTQFVYGEYVTLSGLVPSGPPGTPSGPSVTPGAGRLDVSWTAPSTGGSAITGYDLHYKTWNAPDAAGTGSDPSTGWIAAAHSGTSTTASITGLTGSEAYYIVRVRARNALGTGPWSEWTPLWTARLTAGFDLLGKPDVPTPALHSDIGCRDTSDSLARCDSASVLTLNSFRYSFGDDIFVGAVTYVADTPTGLTFVPDLQGMTLCVGTTAYAFDNAVAVSAITNSARWTGVDVGWSVGDQVFLRLQRSSSCAVVTMPRQTQQPSPTVSLWASPTTVREGSPVTVTVSLSSALSSAVTIPVTVSTASPNTAESGDVGTLTSITIAANSKTGTGTITTNQDNGQNDETFTVSLGSLPSSVRAGSQNLVQVTISDDEKSQALSVSATPACDTMVTDMSVNPKYRLKLTPAAGVGVNLVVVDTRGREMIPWESTISIPESGEHILPVVGNRFADYRAAFPGFAGFKFRLSDDHSITAKCIWWFDDDDNDGSTPETPTTPTTPTTGGGGPPPGGGGPPPGGGGGGPPPAPQSSDASLNTLEVGEKSLDLDPDTDAYTVSTYGETSLTLTPTANHPDAEITVDGETVESGADISIDLEDDGETVITIVVTAEDGTTRTYTLTVMSCPGEERKILEMFYDSTQGDMWEQSGGWNTEDDLRDWHGVRTDEDGRVISLSLPDNGLSGDIPSALKCFSELSGLSELALWDNEGLSGEVPDDLVPAVERAVLRDVAEALELNTEWFEDYEEPFDFEDWHEGVMTDDDGRVTELDFTGEDIEGEIPGSVFELESLMRIETGCGVTLEVEAPEGVRVMPADDCPEETPPEDMEEESGGGGCALGSGDSSVSTFGLFLVTLVVFAALGQATREFN